MKTAREIISHISNKPQNSQIIKTACIDKLLSILPPHLAKAVMFTYIKNRTLFFVLNHPGLKMEFNYKHNLIKSLLNKIKDIDVKCKIIEVEEIKSFVSNKIPTPKSEKIEFIYKERSSGEFVNLATTQELKELFEKIKETIKNNS
jgi:hypothetical protein